jgi:hypothetical protein
VIGLRSMVSRGAAENAENGWKEAGNGRVAFLPTLAVRLAEARSWGTGDSLWMEIGPA